MYHIAGGGGVGWAKVLDCTLSRLARIYLYLRLYTLARMRVYIAGRWEGMKGTEGTRLRVKGEVDRERRRERGRERGMDRKEAHNGKWYSIIPDGHQGISLALRRLARSSWNAAMKSFSNISPQDPLFPFHGSFSPQPATTVIGK